MTGCAGVATFHETRRREGWNGRWNRSSRRAEDIGVRFGQLGAVTRDEHGERRGERSMGQEPVRLERSGVGGTAANSRERNVEGSEGGETGDGRRQFSEGTNLDEAAVVPHLPSVYLLGEDIDRVHIAAVLAETMIAYRQLTPACGSRQSPRAVRCCRHGERCSSKSCRPGNS
jgi:hypothetical protein